MRFGDGDSSLLCARLKERGIPFMIYSGFTTVGGACAGALHIAKPAAEGALVAAMEGLIRGDPIPTQTKSDLCLSSSGGSVTNFAWSKSPSRNYTACSRARNVDPADRTEMEAGVIARTAELMRLGKRMLELDASVTVASLRPS